MEIYQKGKGGGNKRLGEKIGLETWRMYFCLFWKEKMKLSREMRKEKGKRPTKKIPKRLNKEVTEEEIEKAIRKLKKRKAGEHQIKNEVWIFAD